MTAFLARPDVRYKDSFLAGLREFHAEGLRLEMNYEAIASHFENFVQSLRDREFHPRPNGVPDSYYWLIVDSEFVGRVSVRHHLNEKLRRYGGHMGYEIRPSFRRRGFGKLIGQLGLEKARELGLKQVLLTCDDDNIASAKIIEALGGVLEDKIQNEGESVLTRRYWIDL